MEVGVARRLGPRLDTRGGRGGGGGGGRRSAPLALLMLSLALSPPLPLGAEAEKAQDVHGSLEAQSEMRPLPRRDVIGGSYINTTDIYDDGVGSSDVTQYPKGMVNGGDDRAGSSDVTLYPAGASTNQTNLDAPTGRNDPDLPPYLSESMKIHNAVWMGAIMSSHYAGERNSTTSLGDNSSVIHSFEEELIDTEEETRILQQLVFKDRSGRGPKPKNVNKGCECGAYNSPESRIVNGKETAPNEFPWMVSIQIKKDHFHNCGGSIISDYYVITAAHCTDGWLAEELVIRAGDHNLAVHDVSRETYIMIAEIIQHEQYDPKSTNNDLSLLRLGEQLKLTWRVSPICLTPYDLAFYGEKVQVMGWGKEHSKDKLGSPVLRYTSLKVISMNSCRNNFKLSPDQITSKMFCAYGDRTDACQGDSGGPLVWKDTATNRYFIIGITSWGVGCGLPDYPGVYTKLSKFMDWIYAHTEDSVFCSSYSPTAKKQKAVGVGNSSAAKAKRREEKVQEQAGRLGKAKGTSEVLRSKRRNEKRRKKRKKKKKKRKKKKKKAKKKAKKKVKKKVKRLRKKIAKRIRKKLKEKNVNLNLNEY